MVGVLAAELKEAKEVEDDAEEGVQLVLVRVQVVADDVVLEYVHSEQLFSFKIVFPEPFDHKEAEAVDEDGDVSKVEPPF